MSNNPPLAKCRRGFFLLKVFERLLTSNCLHRPLDGKNMARELALETSKKPLFDATMHRYYSCTELSPTNIVELLGKWRKEAPVEPKDQFPVIADMTASQRTYFEPLFARYRHHRRHDPKPGWACGTLH